MSIEIQKVVVKGTFLGQQIRNIFVGMWTDPAGTNDENIYVHAYLDGVYNPIVSLLSSQMAFTEYDVYGLESNIAPQNWVLRYTHSYTVTGTDDYAFEPSQVALLIIGKVADWAGFGRKFFAGVASTAVLAGLVSSTALAALATSAAAYITPQISGGVSFYPGVAHYDPTSHSTTWRPFVSAIVTNLFSTMRRRKIGVGQ